MGDVALAPGMGPAGRPNSVLAKCLLPVSWVYGEVALWRRRRSSRSARRLDRPVVSVGNITCGGTGKTPTVEMVARDLLSLGKSPAILSRGYGGGTAPSATPGSDDGNDEYQVLRANLPDVPHYQGRERYDIGQTAIADGADALILDDGFQHTRLQRDLDLVLVDAIFPFGEGRVLPSGPLREPLEALGDADLFGISRSDQVSPRFLSKVDAYLRSRFPGVPRLLLRAEVLDFPTLGGSASSSDLLQGLGVLAFCGIGNPESFLRLLSGLGADVRELVRFRDHHLYTASDLDGLERRAAQLGVDAVVLTQKDAVKIAPEGARAHWVFPRIAQRIDRGEEAYREALERAVS